MKQVTMESVKQHIADLESAGKVVGGLSLSSEFELACLRELVAVTEQRDALVVENVGLKAEREQIYEIGELIRTQDNRITDQPFFAVMTKREMITSEDHDYDRICWVENKSGDYVEATETQHRRLEAIYQGRYEVKDGWDRFAMKEIDVFVTGCFTEHGCKEYIRLNGHNLNKPFIFAFGSYRNNEYQKVRKFIMSMPETPATDAARASLRAEGVEMFAAEMSAEHTKLQSGGYFDRQVLIYAKVSDMAESFARQLRESKGEVSNG